MEMDSCKLFIGGISWETSEDCLREYFQSFGEVLEAVIMKDRATGRARGFGFILFRDPNVAERVALQKHMIDGKTVEAKKAVPRDDHTDLHKSNGGIQGNNRKIFVGGLASSVTVAEFKKYFAQFGTIMDVVVMYDHKTQRRRGFGFVTYGSEYAVGKVLHRTFHELNGKMVEVKLAVPKEMSPSPNRNLMNPNDLGSSRISTLLNQGFNPNPSPVIGYGVKPEGRNSPAPLKRTGFSPFGHEYRIDLNLEASPNQTRGVGWPYSPGYSASLGNPGELAGGNGVLKPALRNHLWRDGSLGYGSNSPISRSSFNENSRTPQPGSIGGSTSRSLSYHGYRSDLDFGRSKGVGGDVSNGGDYSSLFGARSLTWHPSSPSGVGSLPFGLGIGPFEKVTGRQSNGGIAA
ncbi:PREDICTED: heterogeneous nuclear ribonucleoprotein 1-like [Tarenaya hassleriana]|uniref:heterogeneous nuclear ribonucleoprotein 1-like n=1 Tax=Tarenaya hassleriana TaxID=28532 RepID=UPI00053C15C5|nr:PREDICTED: heterogeneous nuclear ribonucleoprotein 1-like [Tarenaya hassleriana]XP_010538459.1 PREDICTED: heterogeneous nuclear ribonucleoprotein 1-like [Tarenaya hassleriana]